MSSMIEWIDCPKCGSSNAYMEVFSDGDTLLRCGKCGYTVENGIVLREGLVKSKVKKITFGRNNERYNK